ncbi:MAG: peptide deformylase [Chloroflexi bacterium]|nr:peptide deformylase [Chloroflexota bacterium]
MKLEIVQVGDPVLRQSARLLSADEIRSAEIQRLVELMRETMRGAPGVGLAAPQVGEPIRLVVIEDRAEYTHDVPPELLAERERSPVPFQTLANPRLSVVGEESRLFFEGCLSLSGFVALTPRARCVRIEALDARAEPITFEASGWYARILQHEIDHLDGRLYVDRMLSRSLTTSASYRRHWQNRPVEDVCHELGIPHG